MLTRVVPSDLAPCHDGSAISFRIVTKSTPSAPLTRTNCSTSSGRRMASLAAAGVLAGAGEKLVSLGVKRIRSRRYFLEGDEEGQGTKEMRQPGGGWGRGERNERWRVGGG